PRCRATAVRAGVPQLGALRTRDHRPPAPTERPVRSRHGDGAAVSEHGEHLIDTAASGDRIDDRVGSADADTRIGAAPTRRVRWVTELGGPALVVVAVAVVGSLASRAIHFQVLNVLVTATIVVGAYV